MVRFQVKYKSFDEIEEDKKRWRVPFVMEFLRKNGFESALKMVVGTESVQAHQFVKYAFGQLKAFNDANLWKGQFPNDDKHDTDMPSPMAEDLEASSSDTGSDKEIEIEDFHVDNGGMENGHPFEPLEPVVNSEQSDKIFWKSLTDVINQNVVQKLGFSVPEKLNWEGFDLLNRIGSQSQKIAEAGYVESGLATPESLDGEIDKMSGSGISSNKSSIPDMKKITQDIMGQTDSVLGALMLLNTTFSQLKDGNSIGKDETKEQASTKLEDDTVVGYSPSEKLESSKNGLALDEKRAEEMKALFSTAESAMEAWTMLATSLGHSTFIKSEFEKICFLDNASTDTQVSFYFSARKSFSLLYFSEFNGMCFLTI